MQILDFAALKHRPLEDNSLDQTLVFGRGDRIRTYDPLRPRQVRYQAALRPDASILNQAPPLGGSWGLRL